MKRFVLLLSLLLCLAGCGQKEELTHSFADTDFSQVAVIRMQNAHNRKYTFIQDRDDVDSVLAFMKTVSGRNGHSGKGYYEGTYGLAFLDKDWNELDHMGFGDDDVFYYGDYDEMYSVRYYLEGKTKEDVVAFFSAFEE